MGSAPRPDRVPCCVHVTSPHTILAGRIYWQAGTIPNGQDSPSGDPQDTIRLASEEVRRRWQHVTTSGLMRVLRPAHPPDFLEHSGISFSHAVLKARFALRFPTKGRMATTRSRRGTGASWTPCSTAGATPQHMRRRPRICTSAIHATESQLFPIQNGCVAQMAHHITRMMIHVTFCVKSNTNGGSGCYHHNHFQKCSPIVFGIPEHVVEPYPSQSLLEKTRHRCQCSAWHCEYDSFAPSDPGSRFSF